MALNTYTAQARNINQVATWVISSNSNTETFILKAANPAGIPASTITLLTVTANGVLTTAQLAQAIVDAFNALAHPWALAVTASISGSTITFTANSSGVPFEFSVAGTGTSTYTVTVANSGPNDYRAPGNWSLGAMPANDDDVVVQGNVPILYGLAQSGVTLGSFTVRDFVADIGSPGSPLWFSVAGSGGSGQTVLIDAQGGAQYLQLVGDCQELRVTNTGGAPAGGHALHLSGGGGLDVITTTVIERGSVGLALGAGEMFNTTSYSQSGGDVEWAGTFGVPNIHLADGHLLIRGGTAVQSVGTWIVDAGLLEIISIVFETGPIDINGGRVILDAGGIHDLVNLNAGILELPCVTADTSIGSLVMGQAGILRYDPNRSSNGLTTVGMLELRGLGVPAQSRSIARRG